MTSETSATAAGGDGHDSRGAGQVVHPGKNRQVAVVPVRRPRGSAAPARGYWKVTGKVCVLLAAFFSPGTGCTVAVTV